MADVGKKRDQMVDLLLAPMPEIEAALADSRQINDVLDDKVLKTKSSTASSMKSYSVDKEGKVTGQHPTCDELMYLPKGRLEPVHEYTQRVEMTPWFPETKKILNDRQGALFTIPPKIMGDQADAFKQFESDATGDGKSFLWVFVRISEQLMRNGFGAALVDRSVLPADIIERQQTDVQPVTVEEKTKRNLGAPRVVFYTAQQILAFDEDEKGLLWVKLKETSSRQASWDQPRQTVTTVRIIDRVNITSYEIVDDEIKGPPKSVAHNMGECPVVIAHSFSEHGSTIGKPILKAIAQSDLCATRLLSDITWCLFVLGNPLLTFNTDRSADEINDFATGATRYIILRNGKGINDPETLQYTTLDATGIQLMMQMYEGHVHRGQALAGRSGEDSSAVTVPSQQSGVARAWKFKTGEERELFVMTRQLEEAGNKILRLVSKILEVDPLQVFMELNEDFELEESTDALDVYERIMGICEKLGLSAAWKAAIRKIVCSMQGMSDSELEETLQEISELEAPDPEQIKAEEEARLLAMQGGDPNKVDPNIDPNTDPNADPNKVDVKGQKPNPFAK